MLSISPVNKGGIKILINKGKSTIKFGEKLAYGCGDFASNLVYVSISSFLAFFYTDVAGISALTVGTIFLISRIFDGISDLAIGILMEKVHFKNGKARPWILWMAVPYGIGAVLLFSVPNLGHMGKIIYAFVTYNLVTTVIFTAINIPYGVLNSLITQNQYDRALLNTYRMVSAYIAAILVAAVTLPMVSTFGGGARGWTLTFAIFGILAVLLFLVTYRFTKERVLQPASETKGAPKFKTTKALKSLLRNKYWLIIVLFSVVLYAVYALMGIYTYYAKYILGSEALSGPMFTIRNIVELGGVMLTIPIVKRLGKRNVSLGASLLLVLGQIIMIFAPSNYTVILIGLSVCGLGVGAIFGVVFAMVADTIEYEEWRSGIRAEGLVYSAATVGQKMGSAISGAAIGWLLAFSGYQESAAVVVQSESAVGQISFIFLWLPLILGIIMVVLMLCYKLDQEYPAIIEVLEKRHSDVQ
ncbi:MFS transporter [Clostridium sp. AF19-22AC]|nr:MFS transporter [Clostridium sp. AF19-22AC]